MTSGEVSQKMISGEKSVVQEARKTWEVVVQD